MKFVPGELGVGEYNSLAFFAEFLLFYFPQAMWDNSGLELPSALQVLLFLLEEGEGEDRSVDVDGEVSAFVDAAVEAVRDGGIVTAQEFR